MSAASLDYVVLRPLPLRYHRTLSNYDYLRSLA